MGKFPPVLSEYILQCQLYYKSLNEHNNILFEPMVLMVMLTAVSLRLPLGSLDGIDYTIIFIFSDYLWCIQEISLQKSPHGGAHNRAGCAGWRR